MRRTACTDLPAKTSSATLQRDAKNTDVHPESAPPGPRGGRASLARALALTAGMLLALPASAQLGGLLDKLKNEVEREARDAAEESVAKAVFPLEQDGSELRRMSLLLDRYSPRFHDDTTSLERTDTGGFALRPGTYRFDLQSYCLKPGAYGHPGGNGYMSGTLTGKLGTPLRTILANSYAADDIPQRDIQVLIWGLIAGVRISDMKDSAQAAARRLLPAADIAELGGAGMAVPPELSRQALRSLPAPARQAWEALQELRRAASRPDTSFETLEAIAVLDGEAPTTDDDVPGGRWNWHPDGFFIRYDSHGYRRSEVEISVPEPATVERDGLGRIVRMSYPNGDFSRVEYASDVPVRAPGVDDIVAFPVARAEVHSADPETGEPRVAVSEKGVLIALGKRSLRSAFESTGLLYASPGPMAKLGAMLQPSAWDLAPEPIQEAHERAEYYQDRIDALNDPPSQEDVDNFLDMSHYGEGIKSIFGGPGAAYEWLIEHQERQNRALAYATSLLEGMGRDDPPEPDPYGGLPVWEPSGETAHPAATGYAQRLGMSGRPSR